MSEMQILSEANELVRNGLRQAAIDLLVEYLESNPESPVILKAVGKAYLLDKQPERAVFYLQKSLQVSTAKAQQKSVETNYIPETFDESDMDFIDSGADLTADEYSFDTSEEPPKEVVTKNNDRPILSIAGPTADHNQSEKENRGFAIRFRSKKRSNPQEVEAPASEKEEEHDSNPLNSDNGATNQPAPEHEPVQNDEEKTDVTSSPNQITLDDHDDQAEQLGLFDAEDLDLYEEGTTPDLFDDLEHADAPETEYDSRVDLLYQDEDEFPEELVWDDFEDIEEFDEDAQRTLDDEVDTEGKITREQRASQIAQEVIQNTLWDDTHHPLLQQIFIENGWSAAKTAVYNLIDKGIGPDEMDLARQIKQFWAGNPRYWTTFHRIKVDVFGKQAHDGYKQMSWLEAVRIINCFDATPDAEEIYQFIDDLYEEWYWKNRLRRSFKAFFKYLKYRTGSMNRTLPGNCFYSFYGLPENAVGGNWASADYRFSEQHRELNDLGVHIDHWPPPPKTIVVLDGEE
jgi:hypothetical protein